MKFLISLILILSSLYYLGWLVFIPNSLDVLQFMSGSIDKTVAGYAFLKAISSFFGCFFGLSVSVMILQSEYGG